jgi:RNA polymerase sigma factor (sigma-70 family)
MLVLPGNTKRGALIREKLNVESFETVHKQFNRLIYKIMHSLHIYKNQEEFYQTGLIALWEAYEKFDHDKGAFPSYAHTYIKGRLLTALTKDHLYDERNEYKKEEFWELIVDDQSSETLAEELILSYCSNLTKNQKKWVFYTALKMMTISEIAEAEGVSISAVKKWRKGAKDIIRGTASNS